MRLFLLFSFMLSSIFSFAQIEIIENFESSTSSPEGWTTNGFYFYPGQETCNYSNTMVAGLNVWSASYLEALTPYLSNASNATDLSISYDLKVANFSFWDGESPVDPGWGTIEVEYTTDSVTWINLETIDDTNFTSTLSCETRSYSVGSADLPAGENFQMRFKINYLAGEYSVYFDNFFITQVATAIPNCNATLTSPANEGTNVELDASINWSNSTGLATGYKISIGTTSGGTDVADNVDIGNVNTYIPSTALEYTTVYYVTITPYNSFGDAVDCTEQSFTTRNPPPPGSTCDNPFVISDFPYNDSNTNQGFDNDYSTGPCDNSWIIGGDEVVYEITPLEEISINVRFDNLVGVQAAIQVIDGCPDVAQTCFASYGSYTPEPQYFENLILEANHTYYIIVSSTYSDNYFDYHLEVTKNSCVIPDATFTSMEDCDNNQYYAQVEITRMGSAESYTIADDQLSTPQQVTGLGTVTFGPYPTGTHVNFTITNDQDDYCIITGSTEFHCNDLCAAAYTLLTNPGSECTNMLNGSTAEAGVSIENFSICDFTVARDVWFAFEATNSIHHIELSNIVTVLGQWGQLKFEVLEGTCGSLSSLVCSNYTNENIGGLTIGETYYIRVFNSSYENGLTFDICITTPPDAPVNDVCTMAIDLPVSSAGTCDNMVLGTTISALRSPENTCFGYYNDVWYSFTPENTGYYEFELALLTGNPWGTSMSYWTGECGNLSLASDCNETPTMAQYVVAGETTYIMIRSQQGEPGVEFSLCARPILTPANNSCSTPVLFLESTDASGNNLVIDNNAGATHTFGTCYSNIYEELWYTFTPNFTGDYMFNFSIIDGGYSYYAIFEDDCDDFTLAGGLFSCYNSEPGMITVVAGTAYKVAIHGPDPATYKFFVYPVNPPPANDNCATPDILTESAESMCEHAVSGNTHSASSTSGSECGAGDYDVWYSFTPANTGYYQFDLTKTAGTYATSMALFSGDCGALVQESVNCDNVSMIESVEAGVAYTLVVKSDSQGGVAGGVEFNLCTYQVTPPANNECANATAFDESADNTGGNTVSGTNELATYSGEACYGTSYTGVWYTFTAAYSGEYTLVFTGLTGAASYSIYAGSCGELAAITEHCYNTDASTFDAVAGTTYSVSVQAEEASTFEFFVYPSLLPPANNECFDAETFEESLDNTGNNLVEGSNAGAFYSPEACYDETYQGVWYTFTTAHTGVYMLNFTSLTGNASYTMYTGDCETLEYAEGIISCYNTGNAMIATGSGTTYMISVHSDEAASYEFFVYPTEIVGTDDLTQTRGLRYFPNPVSSDRLNVTADYTMSDITVLNTLGQQVMAETPESMNHVINMAPLQSGIYFVRVTIDGAQQTVKIIKE